MRRILTVLLIALQIGVGSGTFEHSRSSRGAARTLLAQSPTMGQHGRRDNERRRLGAALLLLRQPLHIQSAARGDNAASRTLRMMPCDSLALRRMIPRTYKRRLIVALIRCAARRFPVEGGGAEAVCYAQRESSLYPWAKNPSGSWGLYQVIKSTWLSWWRVHPLVRHWIQRARPHFPGDRRLDAYSNAMLSVRVLHDTESPWAGGNYSC